MPGSWFSNKYRECHHEEVEGCVGSIAVLILAGVLIATGATAPAASAQEAVLGYDFGHAVRVCSIR